ncbi:putative GABA permease [Plenodomus tracheiphilus IPT5]|uniref:GABA permease n=1 Tax=Plenodomus tracheiphilus IPT5 TaxID=1408161 RepID=A0A6A7BM37_9PLEO|nr:putative GABA permease [Plenodomus tracheiphilus IPT5]
MEQWPPTHAVCAKGSGEIPQDDTTEFELLDFLNDGEEEEEGAIGLKKASTKSDQRDMYRMGKKQEFKRNYRPLSALSFAVVLTAIWEYLMVACTQGLVNGGTAGLFWSYIWTFVGFTFVEMSLAEMASMAPTSGGQYHWVSEFAPPQYQQILSYLVGWMSTLSWQAGNAADCFLTGTISQALLVVNDPEYDPKRWQGTLFVFAMVVLVYVLNVWGHDLWPRVQNPLMILHVLAFFAVVSTLWCLAPHRSAKAVFTEFSNDGGWPGIGLSLMVGQISAIYSALGSDATAHMAEEVRDASRYVPISLFWSYFGNSLMAIIFLIGFLFAIPDVQEAVNDESGYPFLYVFKNAVNLSGVNALTIIVLLLISAANINFGASTARQTFAFARDNGLPFSSWIAKVDTEKEIPTFYAIVSLQVVSLMFTYAVSISCVLYRRLIHPELLPKARWSLGKWGIPINALGLAYVSFAFFWSFWPTFTPVTAENFNWSVCIFVAVFIACLAMYYTTGKNVYQGPVKNLRRLSVAPTEESITL